MVQHEDIDHTGITGVGGGALTSASQQATANTTSVTDTPTDITGCTISLAAGTWFLWAQAVVDCAAGATYAIIIMTDGSNNEVTRATDSAASNLTRPFALCDTVSPGSTTSYKLRVQTGRNDSSVTAADTRIMAIKVA